jgi:hypothetical protein
LFALLGNEQENGPNCYVIVTGINADVIKESIAIKLPVNVLMKLDVNTNQDDGKWYSYSKLSTNRKKPSLLNCKISSLHACIAGSFGGHLMIVSRTVIV